MAIKSITRVSTDAAGVEGNGESGYSAFSPDGTKVAFQSYASNLVRSDTNGTWDIFVKDLRSGAIERISIAADGAQGNGESFASVFSPDGSRIAFFSDASNLVPDDTNGWSDVFVKDLGTAAIVLVSTAADGTQGTGGYGSAFPRFSPDGSRIAFVSTDSSLVPGDTNNDQDVFVKDLGSGAMERISTAADGAQGNAGSFSSAFSPEGSRIAISSWASNLVPGDTNDVVDVFVKDLGSGAIERISSAADGAQSNGDSSSPVFSPDGSKIAFQSWASNLVPNDTNDQSDVFVKDLGSGAIERISIAADGTQGNNGSGGAVFSPDGSKVAFESNASNLVSGDTNDQGEVFIKDLGSGAIERISIAADGTQGNDSSGSLVFSPDGSRVAFDSRASNLIPGDTNNVGDIFAVELASESVNRITGTPRSDRLIGTEGDDVIEGLAGHDRLKGRDGDDVLLGGRGHDRLEGGEGDDTLIGGKGIDTLTGGQGADLFVIDARSRVPDRILDFTPSEGDRLGLGPLIDSLGLRDEPDVDALVGTRSLGKNIQITLDINGTDTRGGVKGVALLLRPETTDSHLLLDQYVTTDPLALDHGDYWA